MGCTHSFTIEGVNDQLEKLLKDQKIIRTLALKHDGKMVRISRDVRLKGRKDFYFTPEVETTAIVNMLYQGTTFEYEGLDLFSALALLGSLSDNCQKLAQSNTVAPSQ